MRTWSPNLYWKVCLINGAVLCAAALALLLTPLRVSRQPVPSEVLVMVAGLVVTLAANALLLRASLAPVDRVIREMDTVRLGGSGRRVAAGRSGPGDALVLSYHAMLDRLEAERSTSNARALAAQEAERHRVARELHDEVGQSLTVVLLGLKQVEERVPDPVRSELAVVRESARTGLDDVRRVARRLRPVVLEDLGLHAALTALGTDLGRRPTLGGPHVTRRVASGLPALGPDAELVVYRVAQEAMTNVARHAAAAEVGLSLARSGDDVVLEVTDDGRGFDPEAALEDRQGVGLLGMRDRASLVGGDVEVRSAPGRGTTVRLRVPTGEPTGEPAP